GITQIDIIDAVALLSDGGGGPGLINVGGDFVNNDVPGLGRRLLHLRRSLSRDDNDASRQEQNRVYIGHHELHFLSSSLILKLIAPSLIV
ncbi:hypothetical protein HDU67_008523, partial [Dinochytrium kinnereticum]